MLSAGTDAAGYEMFKKARNSKCWRGWRKKGTSDTVDESVKWHGKQYKKVENRPTIRSSYPTSGYL